MRTAMLGGSQDLEHHPIHLATGDDRGSYTVITPKQDPSSLQSNTETKKHITNVYSTKTPCTMMKHNIFLICRSDL